MAFVWGLLHYFFPSVDNMIWEQDLVSRFWHSQIIVLEILIEIAVGGQQHSVWSFDLEIRIEHSNPPAATEYHPPPILIFTLDLLWTNRKIFQTKTSCYDSEFCQRLPSSLLFSYSPCLEQTTKDFKQKHIFLPQNTNPLILIFLPCLSVNPKEKEIKLKSLCPEMLFFFTVIEPSTEREREFKQIQSEILTSYICMISIPFDLTDRFS